MEMTKNQSAWDLVVALGLGDGGRPQADGGATIRCPWHDDEDPSCSVRSYADGIGLRCFACGKTGTAFDLVAVARGLDPKTQFKQILELVRTLATSPSDDTRIGDTPDLRSPTPNDDPEFDQYARALLEACPIQYNASAIAYMNGRGLLERAVADGWGALPDTPAEIQLVTREIGVAGARLLGLETADGLRFPSHRLLIPWRAPSGAIVTLQRRVIDAKAKDRKYIFPAQRATKEPYGVERLREGKPIALTEGAIDTLAMRELCEREQIDRDVIGLPGVQNWHAAWNTYVQGRVVVLAVDNDEAGAAACPKLVGLLRAAGVTDVVRRVPTRGKDWASLLEEEVAS